MQLSRHTATRGCSDECGQHLRIEVTAEVARHPKRGSELPVAQCGVSGIAALLVYSQTCTVDLVATVGLCAVYNRHLLVSMPILSWTATVCSMAAFQNRTLAAIAAGCVGL